jgi:nicotinamide-nucleotide amidase
MKAVVISIGTELLIGSTLNTHAQYLSQTLNAIGISVIFHQSVGDNLDRVKDAIQFGEAHGDLIILTGGLGPTQDDLSRYALAEHLAVPIYRDSETRAHIEGFFTRIGREMTENNLRQADFPVGAVLLENHAGTARGFLLHHEQKTYVALPGPPKELRLMVEQELLKYLVQERGTIHSQFLRVYGIGESLLEARIEDLIENQGDVTLAPYVGNDDVSLRLTTLKDTVEDAEQTFLPMIDALKERLGLNLFSVDNQSIAEALIQRLAHKNMTISTAESCTGGLVASKITSVTGASQVFTEGVITYSNDSKIKALNVSDVTLGAFGAVSGEIALEMAMGLKQRTGTDCGLAITGIAGPDGGSDDKPVGTVFIGAFVGDVFKVFHYKLWGDRNRIQVRAANHALFILFHLLQNEEIGLEIL